MVLLSFMLHKLVILLESCKQLFQKVKIILFIFLIVTWQSLRQLNLLLDSTTFLSHTPDYLRENEYHTNLISSVCTENYRYLFLPLIYGPQLGP